MTDATPAGVDGRGTAAPGPAWERSRWIGWAMVLVGVLLYARALPYGLLGIDDQGYYANPALQGGDWGGLVAVWGGFFKSDYFPLTQWTWWLDLRFGGGGEQWYFARVQSGMWLGIGAWGVWAALRRMGVGMRHGGRMALVVAGIYLVHPLCAPAVLWLAERKNLVAIAFAWWAVERHVAWRQGGRIGCAVASWVLVAAALLAKPHAVAVPLMMCAAEAVLAGSTWRRMAAVAPAFALAAGFTVFDLSQRHDLVLAPLGGSRAASLWCDGPILARYLGQVLWPRDLTIYYPVVEDPARIAVIAVGWAVVAAVVAVTVVVARERRRWVLCGWGLAGAGLAPALNLVAQAAPATDHYVQWALPGLILVGLCVALELWEKVRKPGEGERSLVLVVAAVVGGLAVATVVRSGDFRSRDEFFLRAYAKQPGAAINIAGFVGVLANARGIYDPAVGALALGALRAPDHGRMLGFTAQPVIIAGGAECFRREGQAAAQAAVQEFIQGDDPELGLFLWCEILIGAGRSEEADARLSTRLGPDFLAAAAEIAQRCRAGDPLPNGIPALYRPGLRVLQEEDSSARALVDVLRLGLLLAQIRVGAGRIDEGFGLAGLCWNIDPGNADARGMVARIYGEGLKQPDLAQRVMAP